MTLSVPLDLEQAIVAELPKTTRKRVDESLRARRQEAVEHRNAERRRLKEIRLAKQHDQRIFRKAEFNTRRGQIRIWYSDDLSAGLSEDQRIELDAFVFTDAPFLNRALVEDSNAQEVRIRRRAQEARSLNQRLSRADKRAFENSHRAHKRNSSMAYKKAVEAGEIGKVERFVEELKTKGN